MQHLLQSRMSKQSEISWKLFSSVVAAIHEVFYKFGTDLYNNRIIGIQGMLGVRDFFTYMIRKEDQVITLKSLNQVCFSWAQLLEEVTES